jgi:peptidoglycan biosynthesis protein MviN/MurJ (putative lipid II flippase)
VPVYMKRYMIRLSGFMLAYGIILVVGLTLAKTGLPKSAAIALAVVTAAPICGVFWTIFKLLAECDDEYQRLLFVHQTLLATAMTLVITTVWQFLAVYDVLTNGPQWIGVMWLAMLGIAAPIVWRAS